MIKLIGHQIAVAVIADPDKSPNGLLIIPEEAKERSDQGIVKYIGPDVKDIDLGDYVLFSGYTGTTIQLQDPPEVLVLFHEKFVICKLGNILGAFENLEVPGLFFEDSSERGEDRFFPAVYEIAFNLLMDAVRNTQFAKSNAVLSRENKKIQAKPELQDYEVQ